MANGRVLVPAALLLGVSSLVSRLVGFIRLRALTTTFGAGEVLDAFEAAFRIPDLIFNLVVVGALSAAFIPLFTDRLVNDRTHVSAFRFANSVLNIMVVVVGCLSLFYFVMADYIAPIITPGFTGTQLALTVQLSRIMALQPILLAISFVFSGVLNSFKRFVVYALAPILYNIGIIFGVFVLVPQLGITGLAWGVVLGAVLHMVVQLPSVLAVGMRWERKIDWGSKDLKQMWRLMIPRVVGLAAPQVNLLAVAGVGSTLASGSIAAFHLANNVQFLPIGVFGIAFAQAAFPTLSEHWSRKEVGKFRGLITRTFRYILFFVLPLSLFMWMLRAQIVRVLFGAGQFDWEDTIITFETLGWLVVSIFAQATIPLLARAFYVRQNTRTPMIISLVSMVVNVVLALLLGPLYGVQGLAMAFSSAAILNMVLLLSVLHWQLGSFDDTEVLKGLLKISLAAIGGAFVLQLLKFPVAALVDMQRLWGVLTQLVVTGLAGAATYLFFCWVLKADELKTIYRYLPKHWRLKLAHGLDTERFTGFSE